MAANRIVIDTGPLILLTKIEAVPMAAKLPYHFSAPQNILDELAAGLALGRQSIGLMIKKLFLGLSHTGLDSRRFRRWRGAGDPIGFGAGHLLCVR